VELSPETLLQLRPKETAVQKVESPPRQAFNLSGKESLYFVRLFSHGGRAAENQNRAWENSVPVARLRAVFGVVGQKFKMVRHVDLSRSQISPGAEHFRYCGAKRS
jgi:hypothetical protein